MRQAKDLNKFFKKELKSVSKIEKLFKNDRLDIEFCSTKIHSIFFSAGH